MIRAAADHDSGHFVQKLSIYTVNRTIRLYLQREIFILVEEGGGVE